MDVVHLFVDSLFGHAAFGQQHMDVGIPFEVLAERMEDHDESWNEMLCFSSAFFQSKENRILDCFEEAAEKRTIFFEKVA